MDRELDLDELLQQGLSRRDLFRNAAAAGISLSALLDLAWQPATSTAQTPAPTPKIGAQLIGKLEGPTTITDAAKAKWWTTELQNRVADRCLQLHGGYGYMMEYPVAKAWLDSRVQTIYGGTTEIMKEIIGRGLGL